MLVVEVGILQELGYLKGGVFEPYRYHGVLFLNEISVDWLSVGMWLGTFTSLAARMRTRDLLHLLFVAQTTYFGIPNFATQKESGWNMVSTTRMHLMAIKYRWALGWWKHPCGVLSHLIKGCVPVGRWRLAGIWSYADH